MEHTYTAASPSLVKNPKFKPKQGKVTLPQLKGDISGTCYFILLYLFSEWIII